jgi:DNA-binding GntR family transcriptional regulator
LEGPVTLSAASPQRSPLTTLTPVARKPLGDVVYSALRRSIVTLELAPGSKVTEVEIARRLGVSRTPVREAFQRLELEGWLITLPGMSPRVTPLAPEKADQTYPLIGVLEGLAVRLALPHLTRKDLHFMQEQTDRMERMARRHDPEGVLAADARFHAVLHERTGNPRLVETISELRGQMERMEFLFFANRRAVQASLKRHRRLVRVLRTRDLRVAQRAIERQWDMGRKSVLELMKVREALDDSLRFVKAVAERTRRGRRSPNGHRVS